MSEQAEAGHTRLKKWSRNLQKWDRKKWGRVVLAAIIVATLAVASVSVSTNLDTMYDRWGLADVKPPPVGLNARQLETLEMVSGQFRHRFSVEVMRTEMDRSRGLMFRRMLDPEEGMLFDFGATQPVTMWMKNTYIPLDMIFIRADGRIHRIEARTEPESEKTIVSGAPVKAVLEVNAGVAARLNLKPGDLILHPIFR